MYFPYQVANLLCNEFITSKTFLFDFVNNKTFVNKKIFVGRLTRMAGKREVMTCGLLLCDVTAISRQRHAVQLLLHVCEIAEERLFEHYNYGSSLFRRNRQKLKIVFQIILLSKILYRKKIIAKDP